MRYPRRVRVRTDDFEQFRTSYCLPMGIVRQMTFKQAQSGGALLKDQGREAPQGVAVSKSVVMPP